MNTLEQIKLKQEQINDSLHTLLQGFSTVVERIAGVQEFSDEKAVEVNPDGLIEEIIDVQRGTETLISGLFAYHSILSSKVYIPELVEGTPLFNSGTGGNTSNFRTI